MRTRIFNYHVVSLVAVGLMLFSCGISRTNNIEDDSLPIELNTDPSDTGSFGSKFLDFDTGSGANVCDGEWMTREECLAVDGLFDVDFDMDCAEGQEIRCCLFDELTTPCTDICMAAQWRCEEVGGSINSDECSQSGYVCCAGATFPVPPTGTAFDLATDCPVETPVTSTEQPNKVASGVCVEMHGADGEIFCPQEDYDRVVQDMAAADAAFPVMLEDIGDQSYSLYGGGEIPFKMLCATPTGNTCAGIPEEEFVDLGTCFGTEILQCKFEKEGDLCAMVFTQFEVAVNVQKIFDLYQEHVQSVYPHAYCEIDKTIGLPNPLNGYHVENIGMDVWYWQLRTVDQIDPNFVPYCDVRISYITQPGSSAPQAIVIENESTAECTNQAFLAL